MMNARVLIAGVLVYFLTACASYGPLGTPEFEVAFRHDLPAIEGRLLYRGPAEAFYGVDGYRFIRWWPNWGVIALTEHRLYFVKWIRGKYENDWELDLEKIRSVEVRALGRSSRLVINYDGEEKVTSFAVFSDASPNPGPIAFVDTQKTVRVCQLIAERSGRQCELPK